MHKAKLTEGSIRKHLLEMTLPNVIGIFALMAFSLVDTFFIAQLGTEELAAFSFTFPVMFFVGSIGLGLSTGTASVVSRAIGRKRLQRTRRLATQGIVLAVIVMVALAVIGVCTIEPLFRMLGASDPLLPLIRNYMEIWYWGIIFLVGPMVGNHAIRATGDTKYPSLVILFGSLLNVILDILLIFGIAGFPKMGLIGSAVASVFARFFMFIATLSVLHFREKMVDFTLPSLKRTLHLWKQILSIGFPSAVTNLFLPFSTAILVWQSSRFGEEVVAAVGVAGRVESFSVIPILALNSALVPFVGQNWGAQKYDRIRSFYRSAIFFSAIWGFFIWITFVVFGNEIAALFSKDIKVMENIINYLWIVPLGYGLWGIGTLSNGVLNAIHRPFSATMLSVFSLLLFIPLTLIGSHYFQEKGLFTGVMTTDILAGICAWIFIHRLYLFRKNEK